MIVTNRLSVFDAVLRHGTTKEKIVGIFKFLPLPVPANLDAVSKESPYCP